MDEDWGRAQASVLLGKLSGWLEDEAQQDRWHTLLACPLGALAVIADDTAGRMTAERILGAAPAAAFWEGAIINFDPMLLVRRSLPTDADVRAWFPPYEPAVREYVRLCTDTHIVLAVEGRFDEAWTAAASDLEREECLEAYAWTGQFDRVLEVLSAGALDETRRQGPLMVICIESYRRGNLETSCDTLQQLHLSRPLDCWMWTHLAAGFLGRVPWGGYPFPDY